MSGHGRLVTFEMYCRVRYGTMIVDGNERFDPDQFRLRFFLQFGRSCVQLLGHIDGRPVRREMSANHASQLDAARVIFAATP